MVNSEVGSDTVPTFERRAQRPALLKKPVEPVVPLAGKIKDFCSRKAAKAQRIKN